MGRRHTWELQGTALGVGRKGQALACKGTMAQLVTTPEHFLYALHLACVHDVSMHSYVRPMSILAFFVAASVARQVHDILSRPCSTQILVSQLWMTIPGQVSDLSCKLDDESSLGAVLQLDGSSCKLEMM